MYATLRDELLADECLTPANDSQQSKDAQEWFKEVGTSLRQHSSVVLHNRRQLKPPSPTVHLAVPPGTHMSTSSCAFNAGERLQRPWREAQPRHGCVRRPCFHQGGGGGPCAGPRACRHRAAHGAAVRLHCCFLAQLAVPGLELSTLLGTQPSQAHGASPVAAAVQNLSEEDIFKANSLGWCIEWVSVG